ncbi:hypothetical protein L1D34_29945 [Vibrio mediterranei]|uniref:hypothetical protein n=1 Tax=Vibrio mediterranei TaxID=689 RepID=UPI001EFE60D4|nr:hypothetical protein [Vibrio mediterranei]MCG9629020.1 hypothetical protein [Vibrio mediterranei]
MNAALLSERDEFNQRYYHLLEQLSLACRHRFGANSDVDAIKEPCLMWMKASRHQSKLQQSSLTSRKLDASLSVNRYLKTYQ